MDKTETEKDRRIDQLLRATAPEVRAALTAVSLKSRDRVLASIIDRVEIPQQRRALSPVHLRPVAVPFALAAAVFVLVVLFRSEEQPAVVKLTESTLEQVSEDSSLTAQDFVEMHEEFVADTGSLWEESGTMFAELEQSEEELDPPEFSLTAEEMYDNQTEGVMYGSEDKSNA